MRVSGSRKPLSGRCASKRAICSLRLARQRAKQVTEGPAGDTDRIIRSMLENGGPVSNKSLKDFPALTDEDLVAEIVVAIWATACAAVSGVAPQAQRTRQVGQIGVSSGLDEVDSNFHHASGRVFGGFSVAIPIAQTRQEPRG